MKGNKNEQKAIFRDLDFILLNVNALLVIVGYGLAVYTMEASLEAMLEHFTHKKTIMMKMG